LAGLRNPGYTRPIPVTAHPMTLPSNRPYCALSSFRDEGLRLRARDLAGLS
jgi:hypothetical protein